MVSSFELCVTMVLQSLGERLVVFGREHILESSPLKTKKYWQEFEFFVFSETQPIHLTTILGG
jgi:hypothetical protein